MADSTPARFEGQTVIVTGAGSGIGRATAFRLAAEGAHVIATDVVEQRLTQLAADLAAAVDDAGLTTVAGDVAAPETIDAVVTSAQGQVHGLANVAGIMDSFLPPAEVDDATWDRVMGVNLTGPMRLIRAVLPTMVEAGYGSIVNVASEASFRGSCAGAAYTTSKHALVGLTKSVAFYYGPSGVRANAVAPGPVRTNIEAPMNSQFAAGRVGPLFQVVLPPTAEPEPLAAAIAWLLSPDSANVNGAILPSDGGWSVL